MEPFAVKRTGDDDYPKFIKGLLIGPPKSGKTSFLATFPNPLVGDVEAGLMSIAHKDIPHVTIDHSSKLDTMLTVLKDDTLRKKVAADVGRTDIETVGVDTLDALQELLKKERMRSERRTSFQRDDWGWLLEQFQEIIRSFVALPMHVVFTVHTKTVQDDEGRMVTMPGLQGAIQDQIAGMVGFSLKADRTVEIDKATGQKYSHYTIQTEGDERNPHLGNRAAGRLPRIIEPEFQVLYDAVYTNVQIAKAQRAVEVQPPVQNVTNITNITSAPAPVDTSTPPPVQPEPVAQTSGQSEPTQAAVEQATGAPRDDSGDPISPSAIQHLSKMTAEFGVELNPEVKSGWTLGQAREVARWVVACKTDAAKGETDQDSLKAQVIEGLVGLGAVSATELGEAVPAGNVDEVVEWAAKGPGHVQAALQHEQAKGDDQRATLVTKLKRLAANPPAQLGASAPASSNESGQASEQEETSAPEPSAQPEAQKADEEGQAPAAEEAESEPEPAAEDAPVVEEQPEPPTPEEAEERIKSELGGQEIPAEELTDEQRPCVRCGKSKDSHPEDFDIDIARLSEVRFKEWLCVSDYMALVQQKKAAS